MTFASDLTAFVARTERRLAKTVSVATVKLASKIIYGTPIDLPFGKHDPESVGEARGGWFVSVGGAASPTGLDQNGAATVARITAAMAAYSPRNSTGFTLGNNVPYIVTLEKGGYDYPDENRLKSLPTGYSFQAPHGMMAINTPQWPIYVQGAAQIARTVK